MSRTAEKERSTAETQIGLSLDLDGGESSAATGVGFLDHMLDQLARHGRLGLRVEAVRLADAHSRSPSVLVEQAEVFPHFQDAAGHHAIERSPHRRLRGGKVPFGEPARGDFSRRAGRPIRPPVGPLAFVLGRGGPGCFFQVL